MDRLTEKSLSILPVYLELMALPSVIVVSSSVLLKEKVRLIVLVIFPVLKFTSGAYAARESVFN